MQRPNEHVDTLPDKLLWLRAKRHGKKEVGRPSPPPSRRAQNALALAKFYPGVRAMPFRHGLPDLDQFPRKLWAEITTRRWRNLPREVLGYGAAAGYGPLRQAIAAYLAVSRSMRCHPDQVIVVAGSQQALYLATQLLIDPGDSAWIENPGYLGARSTLLAAGARLIPVSVDSEGINVSQGIRAEPKPKLIQNIRPYLYLCGSPSPVEYMPGICDQQQNESSPPFQDAQASLSDYFGAFSPSLAFRKLGSISSADTNSVEIRVEGIGTLYLTLQFDHFHEVWILRSWSVRSGSCHSLSGRVLIRTS